MVQLDPHQIPELKPGDVGLHTALVVDDVYSMRMLIHSRLRRHGVFSSCVEDGIRARDFLSRVPADLVVTDVEMPNWTGLQLLQWMRCSKNRILNLIPVIVMTSLTDESTRREIRQCANTFFLAKPIVTGELDVILRMIATTRWLRRRI